MAIELDTNKKQAVGSVQAAKKAQANLQATKQYKPPVAKPVKFKSTAKPQQNLREMSTTSQVKSKIGDFKKTVSDERFVPVTFERTTVKIKDPSTGLEFDEERSVPKAKTVFDTAVESIPKKKDAARLFYQVKNATPSQARSLYSRMTERDLKAFWSYAVASGELNHAGILDDYKADRAKYAGSEYYQSKTALTKHVEAQTKKQAEIAQIEKNKPLTQVAPTANEQKLQELMNRKQATPVPSGSARQLTQGMTQSTQESRKMAQDEVNRLAQEEINRVINIPQTNLQKFARGAVSGLTTGLSEAGMTPEQKLAYMKAMAGKEQSMRISPRGEAIQTRQTTAPSAYGAGQLVGSLAGGIGGEMALRGTALAGETLGKQVTRGAVIGGTQQGVMSASEGKSAREIARDVAIGVGLGALGDVALNKIIGGIAKKYAGRAMTPEIEQAIRNETKVKLEQNGFKVMDNGEIYKDGVLLKKSAKISNEVQTPSVLTDEKSKMLSENRTLYNERRNAELNSKAKSQSEWVSGLSKISNIVTELGLPKGTTAEEALKMSEQATKDIQAEQYYKKFDKKKAKIVDTLAGIRRLPVEGQKATLVRSLKESGIKPEEMLSEITKSKQDAKNEMIAILNDGMRQGGTTVPVHPGDPSSADYIKSLNDPWFVAYKKKFNKIPSQKEIANFADEALKGNFNGMTNRPGIDEMVQKYKTAVEDENMLNGILGQESKPIALQRKPLQPKPFNYPKGERTNINQPTSSEAYALRKTQPPTIPPKPFNYPKGERTNVNQPTLAEAYALRKNQPPTIAPKPLKPSVGSETSPTGENVAKANVEPVNVKATGNIASTDDIAQKQSKLYTNTIPKSDIFTPEELENLNIEYEGGYTPKANAETLANAKQRLVQNGAEAELAKLRSKEAFTSDDFVTSMEILKNDTLAKARQTGDYSQVKPTLDMIRKTGSTEAGRVVQAHQIYTRTPEGMLTLAQKVVDNVNKKLPKKKATLSVEDIKNIDEGMQNYQKLPDGFEKEAELAKVKELIADKVPADFVEKFRSLQRISWLLNPKTLIARNTLGNLLLQGAEGFKNMPATAIDTLVSLKTGKRTTTMAGGYLGGLKKGFKEQIRDIRTGVDTSPTGGQAEIPKGKVWDSEGMKGINKVINDTLNTLDKSVSNALKLGDRPFYEGAFQSRINQLKKINKTDSITKEMTEDARLYALEKTLQKDSAIAAIFAGIKDPKALAKYPGAQTIYKAFANTVLPFTKTPANILDKMFEYSPGGFIKAASQLGKKGDSFNQKYFVDNLARGLTGTGIMALGYAGAKNGFITGKPDKDGEVASVERLIGRQPYSFNVDGQSYTFDWAQPISALLAIGADAYNGGKDKKTFTEQLEGSAESAGNTFFNMSMLQGLTGLMEGYSPAVSFGKTIAEGTTGLATPTVGGQITRVIDPTMRETGGKLGPKLIAKTPLLSTKLPAKVDLFGREIKQSEGRGVVARSFENFLSPGYYSSGANSTPGIKEAYRVYKATGEKNVFPKLAPSSFTVKGEPLKLTIEEKVEFQKNMGERNLKVFNSIMENGTYKNMTDENKAKYLKKVVDMNYEKTKAEFLKSKLKP